MTGERIYLFDTTLRDGNQTQGVDFGVNDKVVLAEELDRLGIDYVEGGWPGANPTDDAFFADPPKLARARFTAFGMTRRPGRSADNDPGLRALIDSDVAAVCLVGKASNFHVDEALEIEPEENVEMIRDSIALLAKAGKEALFDAEHFFDGYAADPDYALGLYQGGLRGRRPLGGAVRHQLGGVLPHEVEAIVTEVVKHVPGDHLAIHCHNDTGNAVANTLAAVRAGARMVHGTINGLGERCGNADLVSLIPTLVVKMGYETGVGRDDLHHLTRCSRLLDELLNRAPDRHAPYVGASAFAHKGGLHASAVAKNPQLYEHVPPELVGNQRQIVISDQSGRANVLALLGEAGFDIDADHPKLGELVEAVKAREFEGYTYDGAEASFELMVRRALGDVPGVLRCGQL